MRAGFCDEVAGSLRRVLSTPCPGRELRSEQNMASSFTRTKSVCSTGRACAAALFGLVLSCSCQAVGDAVDRRGFDLGQRADEEMLQSHRRDLSELESL